MDLGNVFTVATWLFLFNVGVLPALSQTTQVVNIGNTTTQQVLDGLGFNLDPEQEWQWAAAAAAGAAHTRFQCTWADVEQQTPPPANAARTPQYVESPQCSRGLELARKYSIHPTIVAAFGPPYHTIMTVTLPHDVPQGTTAIDVHREYGVAGETFHNLRPLYDYICPTRVNDEGESNRECFGQFTPRHSYQGTLVIGNISTRSGIDATLHLASGLSRQIGASTTTLTGCSIEANARRLVCSSTSRITDQERGARLVIPGAGKDGVDLITAITARDQPGSSNVITIAHPAICSVRDATATVTSLYLIHEILYPSTGSDRPSDPSVVAYSNYVAFLAKDMAAHEVSGDIELWNEPPWSNDPWDYRPGLYDPGSYSGPPEFGANFGFAANIMRRKLPAGITVTWNGTSGSASGSLLSPGMKEFSGEELVQPSPVITKESFHPYGSSFGDPEDAMFIMDCLKRTAGAAPSTQAANPFANGVDCYVPGEPKTANFMLAVQRDLHAKLIDPSYGIGHSITETNVLPPSAGMLTQQARGILRQFIGYEGDGVTPIDFYKLYQEGIADPSYSFVQKPRNGNTYSTTPAYECLRYFMQSLKSVSGAPPVPDQKAARPSVTSYNGRYPLALVHIFGGRNNATADSDALVLWQLSSCTNGNSCWFYLPPLEGGQVVLNIPKDMTVSSIVDLVCRCAVKYTRSGHVVRFPVTDNPVEVLVDPQTYSKKD